MPLQVTPIQSFQIFWWNSLYYKSEDISNVILSIFLLYLARDCPEELAQFNSALSLIK